jgi:hypothetical protein
MADGNTTDGIIGTRRSQRVRGRNLQTERKNYTLNTKTTIQKKIEACNLTQKNHIPWKNWQPHFSNATKHIQHIHQPHMPTLHTKIRGRYISTHGNHIACLNFLLDCGLSVESNFSSRFVDFYPGLFDYASFQ